jgi:hypothetical protein
MPFGQGRQARLPFLAQRAVLKISHEPAQTKKAFASIIARRQLMILGKNILTKTGESERIRGPRI